MCNLGIVRAHFSLHKALDKNILCFQLATFKHTYVYIMMQDYTGF